jgi:NADH dehydrogenase/NADH:ubiquinone oxidoreductase subunit G
MLERLMVKGIMNGKVYSFEEGKSILDVLKAIQVHVPTLWYDYRLILAAHRRVVCYVQ